MLLSSLVQTARNVGTTASRSAKIAMISELLSQVTPAESRIAVGFLTGDPRQGRIGIGWSLLSSIESTQAGGPSLTIADIDVALDEIARTTGTGSGRGRAAVLRRVFERATEEEGEFLRRLFLGDLRQGALEGVMAEAIARASGVSGDLVRRAWMLSGDLRETAVVALDGGAPALEQIGLTVLRPIQPMLASTATDVEDALVSTGESSVEWKIDGIRIQVHRDDDQILVFTRNLNDITSRVPELVDIVRGFPEPRFVLDGEAVMLDPEERPFLFQETMSRAGTQTADGVMALRPFFFDCIHGNNEDLIDKPLRERITVLDAIAGAYCAPRVLTDSPREAARFLEQALSSGHEGVVIKALDSPYQAGRRGKTWRKVKPVRTLDLVILAAEWGHGRRQGRLSNLHLGARDPAGGFVMVGKTFKGLTDETLEWQTKEFLAREISRKGITVFVRPELVVEIALDGVQASTRYPGGVALRFARVKRYRPDKDPQDADSIDVVRALLAR